MCVGVCVSVKSIYIERENLSSQRSKIHILFKCTWIIFKDKIHDNTENNPQQIQENRNHIEHFHRSQGLETRNQPQGKNSKTFKFMETELHAIKQ